MKLKAILAHQRSTTAINRLRTLRINQLIHPSIIGQSIFISFLRFARAACPWRHCASGVRRPTNRKSIENVALTETDSLSSTNCRERAPADYSNLFNMNDGFQPSQTNGAGRFYEKGVNLFLSVRTCTHLTTTWLISLSRAYRTLSFLLEFQCEISKVSVMGSATVKKSVKRIKARKTNNCIRAWLLDGKKWHFPFRILFGYKAGYTAFVAPI